MKQMIEFAVEFGVGEQVYVTEELEKILEDYYLSPHGGRPTVHIVKGYAWYPNDQETTYMLEDGRGWFERGIVRISEGKDYMRQICKEKFTSAQEVIEKLFPHPCDGMQAD